MRILVTGGSGFLGRVLVAALHDQGHEVTVVSRHPHADFDDIRTIRADLRDTAAVTAALQDLEVDGVCHLAALTRVRDSFADPAGYYAANVGGTANLLAALERTDQPLPFVFASTCAVYGPTDHPAREDDPVAPGNPYASSKLAAEQLLGYQAANEGLAAISLRCFNVAGALTGSTATPIRDTDLTRLIPKAIAVAAGQEPTFTLNGDGSAVREFTHVVDLAHAYLLALHQARPGYEVLNVGSGQGFTLREVLDQVQLLTPRPLPITRRPPQNEPHTLTADSSLIRRRLGWRPRSSDLHTIVADAWTALQDDPISRSVQTVSQ